MTVEIRPELLDTVRRCVAESLAVQAGGVALESRLVDDLGADAAAEHASSDVARRYRAALVLGSLREDVLWIAPFGLTEYPSFRHFGGRGLPGGYLPFMWPGPRRTADVLYRRALRRARSG